MWNAKTLIVLTNLAIAVGGFISYWKWENFGAFKKDWHDNCSRGIFKSRPVSTGALLVLFILCLLNAGISIRSITSKENLIHFLKMPTRSALEKIMKVHRDSQYKAVTDSGILDPNDFIKIYGMFKAASHNKLIDEITRLCLAKGAGYPNSHLFKNKTGPLLGVPLENWIENYEDTDANGVNVDDKLDSKLGVFVKSCVSELYTQAKARAEDITEEKEKLEYIRKLVPQAIEYVYTLKLQQVFDNKMINEFANMRERYIVQKKINKYIEY